MKKFYIVCFLLVFATITFAQVNFSIIKKQKNSNSTLLRINIDDNIVADENGNYTFKMLSPLPFTSFAVGWDANNRNVAEGSFTVFYRCSQGEKWTSWQDDHGYFRPEEIEPGIFYTDLLFGFNLDKHDSLEIIIQPPVNVQLTKIELVFQDITSENEKLENITTTALNSTKSDCLPFPEYVPRSSWCGSYSECLEPTYTVSNINATHTIIHHGASPYTYTDGAAVVRSYWNYHVNSNGWSDIGYNYLFDKNGNMFQGRHNPNFPTTDVKGSHAGNCNAKSIGLNFIGHSDTLATAPTSVQLEKCWDMLAWWYDYHQFSPLSSAEITNQAGNFTFDRYRISGHRDVNQTESGSLGTTCPGNTLYDMLPNFRLQVAEKMNDCGWNIVLPAADTLPPVSDFEVENWYNTDFTVAFADGTNTNKAFYLPVCIDNQSVFANYQKGFLYEKFNEASIPQNWTIAEGSWSVTGTSLLQSDETLTGTNVYCNLKQERGGSYLYHAKMKISGEGGNRRAGFYFFTDSADRENGYMLFIRADHNTAQLYKYVNGSYSDNGGTYTSQDFVIDPDIWYDVKITFDTQTGHIKCYIDNNLAVSLSDNNPFQTGNIFSLRSAGCSAEYKDIYVSKSRNVNGNTVFTLGENGDFTTESSNGSIAGKIKSISLGNNGLWADYIEKSLKLDHTLPTTNIELQYTLIENDQAHFFDSDNNFIKNKFYNIRYFHNNAWTAAMQNGFAYCDFASRIDDAWTIGAGNWSVENGRLVQTEAATSNLYAELNQNDADEYLYEFDFKLSTEGTNQRVGLHYMSSNGETENHGNGYFIYFRLSNSSSRVEFYRVANDIYSQEKCIDLPLDKTNWHNAKLIYNRNTGESSIYYDNKYYGSYVDPNFYIEGNFVALRNGGAAVYFDNVKVYKSRGETVEFSNLTGDYERLPNIEDYVEFPKIATLLIDSAHNITYKEKGIDFGTGLSVEQSRIDNISLYPNPNNGNFVLTCTEDVIGQEISIFDVKGRQVFVDKIRSSETNFTLTQIGKGCYFAKIGEQVLKFVVE